MGISATAPLDIAETPVRETSTSPRDDIKSTNACTFELLPVISKTKDVSVLSNVRARKVLAIRKASIRSSPELTILTKANSRSIWAPSLVKSLTAWTG